MGIAFEEDCKIGSGFWGKIFCADSYQQTLFNEALFFGLCLIFLIFIGIIVFKRLRKK